MALHDNGDIESSIRDRPIPISPEKTVNVYFLLGLVRVYGLSKSTYRCMLRIPWQIITWFLIIDIMILSYLNDRGKLLERRGRRDNESSGAPRLQRSRRLLAARVRNSLLSSNTFRTSFGLLTAPP